MNPGPDLEAEIDHLVVEPAGECHRERRDLERRQEPVPCRVDLPTAERGEPRAEPCVVMPQELRPRPVTQLDQMTRRVDDVGEQHRREHTTGEGLEVLEPPSMPV